MIITELNKRDVEDHRDSILDLVESQLDNAKTRGDLTELADIAMSIYHSDWGSEYGNMTKRFYRTFGPPQSVEN